MVKKQNHPIEKYILQFFNNQLLPNLYRCYVKDVLKVAKVDYLCGSNFKWQADVQNAAWK